MGTGERSQDEWGWGGGDCERRERERRGREREAEGEGKNEKFLLISPCGEGTLGPSKGSYVGLSLSSTHTLTH